MSCLYINAMSYTSSLFMLCPLYQTDSVISVHYFVRIYNIIKQDMFLIAEENLHGTIYPTVQNLLQVHGKIDIKVLLKILNL